MFTKIVPLLFIFVLSYAVGLCQEKQLKLRVFCYNIKHGNPSRIAATIEKYKPDLVALQEVDVNNGRSGRRVNQAKEIAEKLKMQYAFFKAISMSGGEYGIAILSKYPIVSTKKIDLPGGGEHRVSGIARIDIGAGKKIVFANTYLDPSISDEERTVQMKEAVENLLKETDPVVFAGDFNAAIGTEPIQYLDEHFTRTCKCNCLPTDPDKDPYKYIDHIAFRKGDAFTVSHYEVADEPDVSDHCPLISDLILTIK